MVGNLHTYTNSSRIESTRTGVRAMWGRMSQIWCWERGSKVQQKHRSTPHRKSDEKKHSAEAAKEDRCQLLCPPPAPQPHLRQPRTPPPAPPSYQAPRGATGRQTDNRHCFRCSRSWRWLAGERASSSDDQTERTNERTSPPARAVSRAQPTALSRHKRLSLPPSSKIPSTSSQQKHTMPSRPTHPTRTLALTL